MDKKLFSELPIGNKPILYKAKNSDQDQTYYVVSNILNDLEIKKIEPREIAVLFRAGHNSFHIELELKKAKIPFIKYGGMQFTDMAHIKDMVSILKSAFYPQCILSSRDNNSGDPEKYSL